MHDTMLEGVIFVLALLSVVPIVVAIVMMVGFKKKSGVSLLAAWLSAVLLALFIWNMNIEHASALTTLGFLSAINVILVVFSAIFLLNAMIELKFIETIGNGFNGITQDRRIQILIIAWLFGAFIEGAAGFGTPGALAAPLLVGLGVPVFFAALASLMANYPPVLFGGVGIPPTMGFATIRPDLEAQYGEVLTDAIFLEVITMSSLTNIFVGSFIPFLIIASCVFRDGKGRGLKDAFRIFPLCIFAGLLFTIPTWIISYLGPEIPTLMGSLIALPTFIFAVKKGFLVPKDVYRFRDDPIRLSSAATGTGISLITAWSPYVIIAVFLALSRLPWLPFARLLTHSNATISITGLFGFEGINWSWPVLNNPGLIPFLPVALIFLIARKTPAEKISGVFSKTIKQLKNAVLALLFGVALVQIMRFTNYSFPLGETEAMTTEIARALANTFGGVYTLIGPMIGSLGAFVSGSHTVSNVMFYGLQMEAAEFLGLPIVLALIGQTAGASIGNMVAIHNAVSISATTGATGSEGKMIAAAFIPFILCIFAVSLILFLYLALGINWTA